MLAVGATVARDMQSVAWMPWMPGSLFLREFSDRYIQHRTANCGQVPGRDLSGIHLAMDYLTHNTKAICRGSGTVTVSGMHAVQALLDGGDVSNKWRRWWGAKKNGNRHCKWLDGNASYLYRLAEACP